MELDPTFDVMPRSPGDSGVRRANVLTDRQGAGCNSCDLPLLALMSRLKGRR